MTRWLTAGRSWLLLRFLGALGNFRGRLAMHKVSFSSDGTFMLANALTRDTALLDATTLTWTPTGKNKFDVHDEEGWTLLPNKKVLTVDAYVFVYDAGGTNSENLQPQLGQVDQRWHYEYVIASGSSAAACGGRNNASFEVGPARPAAGWDRLLHWSQRLQRGPHRHLPLGYRTLDGGPGFSGLFRYFRRACGTGAQWQGSNDGEPIHLSNPIDVLGVGRIEPDGNFSGS